MGADPEGKSPTAPGTDFVHIYQPPARPDAPTFLLLHGTGGNEEDLIPLGRSIDPGAALLGVRGQVLENGKPRFFRRLSVGVLDEDDLRARATDLARFTERSATEYGFALNGVVAVGFSNGANIALATIWDHPGVLPRAMLFRAMLPYRTREPQPQSGTNVFLSEGSSDTFVEPGDVEAVMTRLHRVGATVSLSWQEAGHNLTQQDLVDAREWLQSNR